MQCVHHHCLAGISRVLGDVLADNAYVSFIKFRQVSAGKITTIPLSLQMQRQRISGRKVTILFLQANRIINTALPASTAVGFIQRRSLYYQGISLSAVG